ncbi:ATP-binding cassette domain-containing protein [Lapidilactobacillus wuchangensis]|uniref:ATP-binding cassette domain-containing protein n=1 Tax=Lapidilactobacillus wuchangensis TaxID=2486001 RepID=UPI000F772A0E|nr:ABC transporter ATP-binding protein [Lapidilactobacillus wuchangensis]
MSLQAQLTFAVEQRLITVDLQLNPGEARGLYGPSGIGKSTLLGLLAGQSTTGIKQGQVLYQGQAIADLPANQRVAQVSLMFQNPDLQFCTQTPRTELSFCLENQAVAPTAMAAKVGWALDFCGIAKLADQPLVTLSGGEKQLVALACCVVLESRYLLLDEPFANLDQQTSQRLVSKLKQLQRERQVGILLIDHQIENTSNWVDQWYAFSENQVALTTRSHLEQQEELLQQTLMPVVKRSLVAAAPVLTMQQFSLPVGDHRLLFPDVTLAMGQMIGITGRSGLGKSTFLKSLMGLAPHQGQLLINGQRVKKCRRRLFKQLSWVMQNPQDQFIAVTVAQELANRQHANQGVAPILQQLGLTDKADVSPFLLSQGQQRRLAVASFLERPLTVLLVDEPTYGQDRANAWQLMTMLRQKADQQTLVLVVSHDQQLLRQFCDEVWDLNQAVEVADATVKSNG